MSKTREPQLTAAALTDEFKKWIKRAKDNKGEYRYHDYLRQIGANRETSVEFDANLLPPNLFYWLVNEPDEALPAAKDAVYSIISEMVPSVKESDGDQTYYDNLDVRFFGLDTVQRIDKSLIHRFACIEGKVTAMTDIFQVPYRRVRRCVNCNSVNSMADWIRHKGTCPACSEKAAYTEEIDESNIRAYRQVEVVVLSDRNRGIETEDKDETTTQWIELWGDLAYLEIEFGDTLRSCGVFDVIKSRRRLALEREGIEPHELIQIVNSLQFVNEKKTEVVLKPEDVRKIQDLAMNSPSLMSDLVGSFAPHIYVDEDSIEYLLKEAIIYSLVGADVDLEFTSGVDLDVRGDIHIIIIGDPSTGKSEIVLFAVRVSGGIYASAEGLSRVGISVGLEEDKKTGKRVFRGGLAIVGDGQLKGLDEIDKVPDKAFLKDLYTILDKGIYTLWKIRNKVFKTRGPWLVTGNPARGIYDPYKEIGEQVGFNPALLNRFDLIGVLTRSKSRDKNARILEAIKNKWRGRIKSLLSVEDITKYLYYAKNHNTQFKIDDVLLKPIDDYYLDLASIDGGLLITERQYEGMIRLAIGRARTHLRDHLTIEDVERAKYLMERFLASAGVRQLDRATGEVRVLTDMRGYVGQGEVALSKKDTFFAILERMLADARLSQRNYVELNAFKEALILSRKFKNDLDAKSIISNMEREGIIYVLNDQVYKRS